MNKLIIQEDKNTPNVILDPENFNFRFFGKSFPENSKKFYQPVIEWLEKYAPPPGSLIEFNFYFYYLSSSSVIAVLEILKRLGKWRENGITLKINWSYDEDDEEIRRIGEDYMKIVEFPFNFVPTAEE